MATNAPFAITAIRWQSTSASYMRAECSEREADRRTLSWADSQPHMIELKAFEEGFPFVATQVGSSL